MQPSINDIDACRYLYLAHISEPEVNQLRLVLEEAGASFESQDLTIGDTAITGLHAIRPLPDHRAFEILWPTYLGYSIRNESHTGGDDHEAFQGRLFVQFSKSHYLDFLAKSTFASSEGHPGPFKHWGIFCLDHVIDIVSQDEPIIHLLPSS